ncbi:MAG: hypothetical protein QM658_05190 [Gordonia sp. (in: high G+C Gram-positive bacteria)]
MRRTFSGDPGLAALIADLRERYDDFVRLWDTATIVPHADARKTIDHPEVGPVELDCDVVSIHGADLRMVVFTADPASKAVAPRGARFAGDVG